ncbi:hypothetical protein OAN24_06190, partial [Pseudodesulfovibrio sp.]|nr:hypothetical protein [Pseudodesulfovibrio sp.]
VKRKNRVTATVGLGKLRPKNTIEIHPGSQTHWHCPTCATSGDACGKPNNWQAMESQYNSGAIISGGVSCPQCGTSHPMADIVSGKYDIVMVDINCSHCDYPMAGPIESWVNCECMKCGKMVIEK